MRCTLLGTVLYSALYTSEAIDRTLVPNLGKPLYRGKTVYSTTNKTAINRPIDHTGET